MEHRYRVGAEVYTLRPDRTEGKLRVHVDDASIDIDDYSVEERYVTVRRGASTRRYLYARVGRHIHIALGGRTLELVPAEEESEVDSSAGGFTPEVVAPMPGKILQVLVAKGDRVQAGAPMLVLEAMKMEQTVRAAVASIVRSVNVEIGAMVGPGQTLIVLEAEAAEGDSSEGA